MHANCLLLLASLILDFTVFTTSHPLVSLRSLHHAPKGSSHHERQARLVKRHNVIRTVWEYPENEEGYNFGDNIRIDALAALDDIIPKGEGDREYWACHVFSLVLPNPDEDVPEQKYSEALADEFNRYFKGRYRNPIRNVDGSASIIIVAQITQPADDRFFAYVQMIPEKPGVKLTMFEQAFPSRFGDRPSDGLEVSWRREELFWDPDRAAEELPPLKYLGRVNRFIEEENKKFFDPEHGKIMQGVLNAADRIVEANPKFDGKMNRPQNFRDKFARALVEQETLSSETSMPDQVSLEVQE